MMSFSSVITLLGTLVLLAGNSGPAQATSVQNLSPLAAAVRILIAPHNRSESLKVLKPGAVEAVPLRYDFDLSCHIASDPVGATLRKWLPDHNVSHMQVNWFRGDHPFRDSHTSREIGWLDMEPREDYQLRFHNFTLSDAGQYRCRVKLGHLQINVKAMLGVAPRLLIQPKVYTHAMLGARLALQCQAIGYPEPSITWMKVPALKTVAIHSHLFKIAVAPADSGHYRCIAKNSVGSAQAETDLLVTEPLTWIKRSASVVPARLGSSKALQCRALGYPLPTAQWQFRPSQTCSGGASRITKQDQGEWTTLNHTGWRLVVRSIAPAQLGLYRCVVSSRRKCCPDVVTQEPIASITCLRETTGQEDEAVDNVLSTAEFSTGTLGYSSASRLSSASSFLPAILLAAWTYLH